MRSYRDNCREPEKRGPKLCRSSSRTMPPKIGCKRSKESSGGGGGKGKGGKKKVGAGTKDKRAGGRFGGCWLRFWMVVNGSSCGGLGGKRGWEKKGTWSGWMDGLLG